MEKFKQKVASSSSRVIASLQQAASGRAAANSQPQPEVAGSSQVQPQLQLQRQDSEPLHEQPTTSSSAVVAESCQPAGAGGGIPTTASKLISSNATAHLTEAEKEILLQVFKKEKQFELDTIK